MNRIHIRIPRRTLVLGALSLAAVIGIGGVSTAMAVEGMNAASSVVGQSTSNDSERAVALARTQGAVAVERVRMVSVDKKAEEATAPVVPDEPIVTVEKPVPAEPAAPVEKPAAPVEKPAAPVVTQIPATTMYVTTSSLNIRAGAGANTNRVGSLAAGTRVVVNGKANGFNRLADGRGWVSASYLSTKAPAPAAPSTAWSTYVGNRGDQPAIDACTGGVTDWTGWEEMLFQGDFYVVHNNCGGMPVLDLEINDIVEISGQRYAVSGATAIPYPGWNGAPAFGAQAWWGIWAGVTAMNGDAYVQTCYLDHGQGMRVVALKKL